jgi:hypothetical protein
MNRKQQIEAKRRELQTLLTKWATQEGILRPGQQLIFKLEIVGTPLVVDNSPEFEEVSPRKPKAVKIRGMHITRRSAVKCPAELTNPDFLKLIDLFEDEPAIIGWLVRLIEDNKNLPVKKHRRIPYINKVLRSNMIGSKKLTIVTKKGKAQMWVLKD